MVYTNTKITNKEIKVKADRLQDTVRKVLVKAVR